MGQHTGFHQANSTPRIGNSTKVLHITPQMQSPVTTASNDPLARQLRAVHKEQQGNSCGGQIFKEGDEIASGRKERGQQHHRDQG